MFWGKTRSSAAALLCTLGLATSPVFGHVGSLDHREGKATGEVVTWVASWFEMLQEGLKAAWAAVGFEPGYEGTEDGVQKSTAPPETDEVGMIIEPIGGD